MLWRRHRQVVEELDGAGRLVGQLLHRIADLEAELEGWRVPAQVTAAMRSHGDALRPVRVRIEGHAMLLGVRPTGRTDPVGERREWRRLLDQEASRR